MNSGSSYTVDRETAAILREWLFEKAVEKHGESDISEPLAELAAAIDAELHEQAEAIELGTSARTIPPATRDTPLDDRAPVDEHRTDDARTPAKTDALDAVVSEADRIYDTLPDSAWQLNHDQSATAQDDPSTAVPHDRELATSNHHPQRQNHCPSVRYRISYQCTVCGGVRELETSLRVCAFVDDCPGCGAVARFAAARVPTQLRES